MRSGQELPGARDLPWGLMAVHKAAKAGDASPAPRRHTGEENGQKG